MGWQPDVVCDNTHAQQITVHLRSIRPRKLAHVTDIFSPFFIAEKTRPSNSDYCDFYFWNWQHTYRKQQFQTPPDNNRPSGTRDRTSRVTAYCGEAPKLFTRLHKNNNNNIMFPPTRSTLLPYHKTISHRFPSHPYGSSGFSSRWAYISNNTWHVILANSVNQYINAHIVYLYGR